MAHAPPREVGTHSVDRQYNPCESHTQELIWCNFKLLQSVWGHHCFQRLSCNTLGLLFFWGNAGETFFSITA